MSWARRLWLWLHTLFRRERTAERLDDEIQFDIDQRIAENLAAGMSPEEVGCAAMRTLGNPTVLKEETRDTWGWKWLEQIVQDLRYGARALANNPGFTTVAVAIALGIGVNTGIFSVLNGVALKLLPVPSAEQIVSVSQFFHGRVRRNVHGEPELFSYSEYRNYRANNHVFSGLIAYAPFLEATLGGESPKQLLGAETSCNFFDVLGERPALGRTFVEEDCSAPGASPVVVLGDELWRDRFGADRLIVGKSVSLNRANFVVVGVARVDRQGRGTARCRWGGASTSYTAKPRVSGDRAHPCRRDGIAAV